MRVRTAVALFLVFFESFAWAIPDTTLARPDFDIKRLFPESTNYSTRALISGTHVDASALRYAFEKEQVSDYWKSAAVNGAHHNFYTVYKSGTMIGLVYGVTTPLGDDELQIFTGFDKQGKLRDVYFQKISIKDGAHFRSKYYRHQFRSFSLARLPDQATVKPPVRFPNKEILAAHKTVIEAVRICSLIVKNFYNAAKN